MKYRLLIEYLFHNLIFAKNFQANLLIAYYNQFYCYKIKKEEGILFQIKPIMYRNYYTT